MVRLKLSPILRWRWIASFGSPRSSTNIIPSSFRRSTRVRPTNLNVSNASNTIRKKSSDTKRTSLCLPAEEQGTYPRSLFDSFDMADGQPTTTSYDYDKHYAARRSSLEERRRPTESFMEEFQRSTLTMVKFSDSTCDVHDKVRQRRSVFLFLDD